MPAREAERRREERLLNSASYFDLRGRLSLTNPAQEAALYATTVHIYGLRLKTLLKKFLQIPSKE